MANNPKHWIGFSCCHKNVSNNTVQRRAMFCQKILDKFTHKLTYCRFFPATTFFLEHPAVYLYTFINAYYLLQRLKWLLRPKFQRAKLLVYKFNFLS